MSETRITKVASANAPTISPTLTAKSLSSGSVVKKKKKDITRGDLAEQQFYKAGVGDTTSVKIPIVYGTVLTKGVVIDTSVTQATTGLAGTEKDTIQFKHYKILISEGDCNGIKSNVQNHTVINGKPLVNSDTNTTELNGVEIKQKKTTATDWATGEKISEKSKDVDISVFKGSTTNLASSVTRVGFLQGLSDVSTELNNGFMLQYNSDTDRFTGKHINDIINDAGLFTTTDANPSAGGTNIETWIIPHATSYTVTEGTDTRPSQSPFRWWKAGSNAGAAGSTTSTTIYNSTVVKLDSLFRPDILMYDNLTYTFTCSGLSGGFFLTSDLTTEFTTGVSSTSVAAGTAMTTNGIYTFTPTSATPRILYYRTQTASNTGGRILVRSP
jgi:hypothetical protein